MHLFHKWRNVSIDGPLTDLLSHMSVFCVVDQCVKCGLYKIEDWRNGQPEMYYYDFKKDRLWV